MLWDSKSHKDTNMKLKPIFAILLIFTFVGVAAADETAGKSVYMSKCSICHGPDGRGNTAIGKNLKIKDFHSPEVQSMSEADMKAIVTNGKNKMPSFKGKLIEKQIDDVVDYVRDLGKQ